MQGNDQRISEIRSKIALINRIKNSNRDKVVRMVDYIVNQMPEPIWISELRLEAKAGSEVQLRGYSITPQTISGFFTKLENGVFFSNWQLLDASREKLQRGDRKELEASRFELRAQVSEVP